MVGGSLSLKRQCPELPGWLSRREEELADETAKPQAAFILREDHSQRNLGQNNL